MVHMVLSGVDYEDNVDILRRTDFRRILRQLRFRRPRRSLSDFGSTVIQRVLGDIAKICDAVLLIEIVERRDVNYLGNLATAY